MVDIGPTTTGTADDQMGNLGILCFIAFTLDRTIPQVSEARREMGKILRNMRLANPAIARLFLKRVRAIDWVGTFNG